MGCYSTKAVDTGIASDDAEHVKTSGREGKSGLRGGGKGPTSKAGGSERADSPKGDLAPLRDGEHLMDIPSEIAAEPSCFIAPRTAQHFHPGARLRGSEVSTATPTPTAVSSSSNSNTNSNSTFDGGWPQQLFTSSSESAPSAPPRPKPLSQLKKNLSGWGDEPGTATMAVAADVMLPTTVVDWFLKLDDRGQKADIALKCKAPLVLLLSGRTSQAKNSLLSCAKVLQKGATSSLTYYSREYVQAPWFWLFWAATGLNEQDVASTCYSQLGAYRHRFSDSGLVKSQYTTWNKFEADFYATALLTKAALIRGAREEALSSGLSLLRAVRANERLMEGGEASARDGHLMLVFSSPVATIAASARTLMVRIGVALPALVMLELSAEPISPAEQKAFHEAALRLLSFLASSKMESTATSCLVQCHLSLAAALANRAEFSKRFEYNFEEIDQRQLGTLSPSKNLEQADQVAESWIW
eukprot:CAMPEP_0206616474 /NCGR_PEP_ID=MMETSP0325_2-20121206/59018_1 /ASSEMBLY_ACC=CAM_ASM_000347 /TAXON_ID=2866 /ORGANISM="Crypthecodinium cohnii, Strain Seligo" /LENGTH=470 /DNA_ID=CAMNT_0054138187 /DNA_START=46 /DNA_END=1456 /DNA_ORIENTATION=+